MCASQAQLFNYRPEAAALGAVSGKTRSQAAKREELLAKTLQLSPPLKEDMAGSALRVMEAHKKRGLILGSPASAHRLSTVAFTKN